MNNEWDLAENVSHSQVCIELMTCCLTGFHAFSAILIVVTLKFGTWYLQFVNFRSLIKCSSETTVSSC